MLLRACVFACGVILRHHPSYDASMAANSPEHLFSIPMEQRMLMSGPEPQDCLDRVHLLLPEPVTVATEVMV